MHVRHWNALYTVGMQEMLTVIIVMIWLWYQIELSYSPSSATNYIQHLGLWLNLPKPQLLIY